MLPEIDGGKPRNVGIIGLGVMGGSLARALTALEGGPRVIGWSASPEDRRAAEAAGAVHEVGAGAAETSAEADLVVLAAPLSAALSLLHEIRDALNPGTTVVDLVGLKEPVRQAAVAAGLARCWVGCHPMCGSEASGFAAASAELYRDAPVWIVAETEAEAHVPRVTAFWEALGARPRTIGAPEHDRLMALVSHLPQLAANALARVLQGAEVSPRDLGPGGRDMTRLAGSSVEMWTDLLAHSPPALPLALEALSDHALSLANALSAGNMEAVATWMRETRAWRTEA